MKQIRKLYLGTALSLGTLAGAGFAFNSQAFEAATRAIDFNKVNQTLKKGFDEVVSVSSTTLQKFNLRFEPRQTNVDNDRYTMVTNFTLPRSAWSDKAFKASARLSFKVDTASSEGNTATDSVKFGLNAQLRTESLAMIKYIGKTAISCPTPDSYVGVERLSMDEHCRMADQLQQAQNLKDLRVVFKDHIDQMQARLKEYIDQANQDLAQIRNDVVKQQIEREVKSAQKFQTTLEGAQIVDTANGFSAEFKDVELGVRGKIDSMKLTIEPKQFNLELTLETRMGAKLYKLTKPEVVRMLRALEGGEDWAVKDVQMEARIVNTLLSTSIEGTDLSQRPVTTSR
jgi:hypothetical protein